jgi:hypothetical protein
VVQVNTCHVRAVSGFLLLQQQLGNAVPDVRESYREATTASVRTSSISRSCGTDNDA